MEIRPVPAAGQVADLARCVCVHEVQGGARRPNSVAPRQRSDVERLRFSSRREGGGHLALKKPSAERKASSRDKKLAAQKCPAYGSASIRAQASTSLYCKAGTQFVSEPSANFQPRTGGILQQWQQFALGLEGQRRRGPMMSRRPGQQLETRLSKANT